MTRPDPCDIGDAVVRIWDGIGLGVFLEQYGIAFLIGVAGFVLLYRWGGVLAARFGKRGG